MQPHEPPTYTEHEIQAVTIERPSPESQSADYDSLLMTRVRRGDREAIAAIFDRYAGALYWISFRLLADPQQAEGLVSDILCDLWIGHINPDSRRVPFGIWLMILTLTRAKEELSKRESAPQPPGTRPTGSAASIESLHATKLYGSKTKEIIPT